MSAIHRAKDSVTGGPAGESGSAGAKGGKLTASQFSIPKSFLALLAQIPEPTKKPVKPHDVARLTGEQFDGIKNTLLSSEKKVAELGEHFLLKNADKLNRIDRWQLFLIALSSNLGGVRVKIEESIGEMPHDLDSKTLMTALTCNSKFVGNEAFSILISHLDLRAPDEFAALAVAHFEKNQDSISSIDERFSSIPHEYLSQIAALASKSSVAGIASRAYGFQFFFPCKADAAMLESALREGNDLLSLRIISQDFSLVDGLPHGMRERLSKLADMLTLHANTYEGFGKPGEFGRLLESSTPLPLERRLNLFKFAMKYATFAFAEKRIVELTEKLPDDFRAQFFADFVTAPPNGQSSHAEAVGTAFYSARTLPIAKQLEIIDRFIGSENFVRYLTGLTGLLSSLPEKHIDSCTGKQVRLRDAYSEKTIKRLEGLAKDGGQKALAHEMSWSLHLSRGEFPEKYHQRIFSLVLDEDSASIFSGHVLRAIEEYSNKKPIPEALMPKVAAVLEKALEEKESSRKLEAIKTILALQPPAQGYLMFQAVSAHMKVFDDPLHNTRLDILMAYGLPSTSFSMLGIASDGELGSPKEDSDEYFWDKEYGFKTLFEAVKLIEKYPSRERRSLYLCFLDSKLAPFRIGSIAKGVEFFNTSGKPPEAVAAFELYKHHLELKQEEGFRLLKLRVAEQALNLTPEDNPMGYIMLRTIVSRELTNALKSDSPLLFKEAKKILIHALPEKKEELKSLPAPDYLQAAATAQLTRLAMLHMISSIEQLDDKTREKVAKQISDFNAKTDPESIALRDTYDKLLGIVKEEMAGNS